MKRLNNDFKYIGNELTLFKEASNWKTYFSNQFRGLIKGDVLEVGAGIGSNTAFLFNNKSSNITSWSFVEPDSSLASQIESNIKNLRLPSVQIHNCTLSGLKEQTFNTIIYIDVLEHIEDSKKEMILAKERLNTGGVLIVLVPAYNFLFSKFDRSIGHFRRYNKKIMLRDIGEEKLEELYYIDSIGFFASLLNKFVLKKSLPSVKEVKFWDKLIVPLSRIFDFIFFRSFGKSLIAIYKK